MRGFSFILATVKAQPAVSKMYASKSLQQLSEIGPLINPCTQAYTHIITDKNIDLLHIHNYRNVKSECIWRQNTVPFFFPLSVISKTRDGLSLYILCCLEANTVVCRSFMDSVKSNETHRSEMKDYDRSSNGSSQSAGLLSM